MLHSCDYGSNCYIVMQAVTLQTGFEILKNLVKYKYKSESNFVWIIKIIM